MKYYSENTVKGLLEQIDSHFVKYLESLTSIEIKEPHGRCIDVDALPIKDEWSLVGTDVIWDAPTVLAASNQQCEKKKIAGNQQWMYWCCINSTFCEYATSKGYCSITACCKK